MRYFRHHIFLWILILCVSNASRAQMDYYNNIFQHQKDSLQKELSKHPNADTARVNALMELLGCAIFSSQKKQLMSYWSEGRALSHQLRYKSGEAYFLEWKGSFYKSQQKTDSAMLYLDSAIAIAGNDTTTLLRKTKGFSFFEKGMQYEFQENFYTALNNYFASLKSYEGIDPTKQKMASLRIADIYKKLHNDTKALEYYQSALSYYNNTNAGKTSHGAEGIYTYIASIYYNRNDLQNANAWLDKMKPFMPDSNETIETGGYYNLAGKIASKERKTDSAIVLLKEALHYFGYTAQMHVDEIAATAADIAQLEISNNNLAEAKKYAELSMSSAQQSGRKETLANALSAMAAYYHKSGNQLAAYEALERSTLLSDSILQENNVKQAATLSAIYENGKKEKEITQLEADKKMQAAEVKEKKLLNSTFIIVIVALLIIAAIAFINFKNKQKIERQKIAELEKEKQLTGVEAMLKGEESERSRLAKDLHDGLGGMLSGTRMSFSTVKENMLMNAEGTALFDKSLQQLDNTITELRKVAHNMMPEALVKYGLGSAVADFCESMQLSGNARVICEQFGTDRQLNNSASVNIYRIIQELVNNAIIHGKAAQVLVQLSITNDKVLITVEDNGKGFDMKPTNTSRGIGLNNIQHRVNYFHGKIEMESSPGNGTTVNIELTA